MVGGYPINRVRLLDPGVNWQNEEERGKRKEIRQKGPRWVKAEKESRGFWTVKCLGEFGELSHGPTTEGTSLKGCSRGAKSK